MWTGGEPLRNCEFHSHRCICLSERLVACSRVTVLHNHIMYQFLRACFVQSCFSFPPQGSKITVFVFLLICNTDEAFALTSFDLKLASNMSSVLSDPVSLFSKLLLSILSCFPCSNFGSIPA